MCVLSILNSVYLVFALCVCACVCVCVCVCVCQANHRKFLEHVTQGSVKKVEKMLDSGVDPNFITEDGSEYD